MFRSVPNCWLDTPICAVVKRKTIICSFSLRVYEEMHKTHWNPLWNILLKIIYKWHCIHLIVDFFFVIHVENEGINRTKLVWIGGPYRYLFWHNNWVMGVCQDGPPVSTWLCHWTYTRILRYWFVWLCLHLY